MFLSILAALLEALSNEVLRLRLWNASRDNGICLGRTRLGDPVFFVSYFLLARKREIEVCLGKIFFRKKFWWGMLSVVVENGKEWNDKTTNAHIRYITAVMQVNEGVTSVTSPSNLSPASLSKTATTLSIFFSYLIETEGFQGLNLNEMRTIYLEKISLTSCPF